MFEHSVADIWIAFEGPSLPQLYTNKKNVYFMSTRSEGQEEVIAE